MCNIEDIKNTVIHGDSEIEIKKIPDESIDYIGIEIDKEYYDICCDRIKEKQGLFTGVKKNEKQI